VTSQTALDEHNLEMISTRHSRKPSREPTRKPAQQTFRKTNRKIVSGPRSIPMLEARHASGCGQIAGHHHGPLAQGIRLRVQFDPRHPSLRQHHDSSQPIVKRCVVTSFIGSLCVADRQRSALLDAVPGQKVHEKLAIFWARGLTGPRSAPNPRGHSPHYLATHHITASRAPDR